MDITLRVMTLTEFLVQKVYKIILYLNIYKNTKRVIILRSMLLSGIYCTC